MYVDLICQLSIAEMSGYLVVNCIPKVGHQFNFWGVFHSEI